MKLKEKFKVINCTDCDMPYCDVKCTILSDHDLDELEKILDNFTIEFLDWCTSKEATDVLIKLIELGKLNSNPTSKDLLQIYKQEKGL